MDITVCVQVRPTGSAAPLRSVLMMTLEIAPTATLTAGQLLSCLAHRAFAAQDDAADETISALRALWPSADDQSPEAHAAAAHRAGRFWLFVNSKPATSLSQPLPLWRRLDVLVLGLSSPAALTDSTAAPKLARV